MDDELSNEDNLDVDELPDEGAMDDQTLADFIAPRLVDRTTASAYATLSGTFSSGKVASVSCIERELAKDKSQTCTVSVVISTSSRFVLQLYFEAGAYTRSLLSST